jgi:hypothetical protein
MIVVDGVGFQIGRWRVLRLGRSRDREAKDTVVSDTNTVSNALK